VTKVMITGRCMRLHFASQSNEGLSFNFISAKSLDEFEAPSFDCGRSESHAPDTVLDWEKECHRRSDFGYAYTLPRGQTHLISGQFHAVPPLTK
jgi:hypothetical protein